MSSSQVLLVPSRVARNCSRPRTPREGWAPVPFIMGLTTVRTLKLSRFSIWTKESKSGKTFKENKFFRKKCQTWTALPDTESPPKYFILGKLGNPDSSPKATWPSSPKLPRLGNLRTIGEGHFVSTPARPSKDRPLLTMISIFENMMCSYSGY